jgi:hypothetical protein
MEAGNPPHSLQETADLISFFKGSLSWQNAAAHIMLNEQQAGAKH